MLSEPALSSGRASLQPRVNACHAAWTSATMLHVMQKRVHAKICMREAPVPLGRPLPGLGQGRDPSLNRSTCAHEAWNAACASVRVSKMMRACCACIKETARGLTARLPRTAEIGDSQKAKRRALAHAMMHGNEIRCMEKHARDMLHAT